MKSILKATCPLLTALVLAAVPACTVSTTGSGTNEGPSTTPSKSGDDVAAQPGSSALSFKPSNVDISDMDLSKVGDIILSGSNCTIATESKLIACDDDSKAAFKIVTLPDQSRLAIYVVNSLRIESSAIVTTRDHLPLVVVALHDITMLGSIDVPPGTAGGAFDAVANAKGQGPGGGTAGDTNSLAGGGASFCGLGGKAGTEGAVAPHAPSAYGNPELSPLVAGSAGGSGTLVSDGHGGGAIQLVAGGTITLKAGAYINVGGAGGSFGGAATYHQEAGAAGSGGAILLEAPSVIVEGTLSANGGGGGQGFGDSGEAGHPSDTAAAGGQKLIDLAIPSPGGSGSSLAVIDGQPGTYTKDFPASGGGGGAGRIRINTANGNATLSGVVSPGITTACATQGTLTKK